ncbi:hypothetical protein [Aquimarina sediminis]|uniref:hypothetical protein n=1 Tax=Aquimarina sediminis TaxID=2070536 RepID=UPI000FFEFCFD|nr:hypothetical protein [Aquimarina sediminis]
MKKIIFGTVIFILVSFATQSISHFVINIEHYASIPFMRKEPIFILGFLTMTIQGVVLSYLFQFYSDNEVTIQKGLFFGLMISALFVSYPALVEPAKYQVPNVLNWVLVEGIVGIFQFTLFGVLLSLTYKKLK